MAVDIAELRSLPRDEKLRLVNLLWEDLHATAVVRFSDEEMAEIRRRDQEMREHPERSLTTEQMWAQVNEKRQ
jgi:putative addiction module component (TIGR02574 family)